MKTKLILGSIFAFASAALVAQSWSITGNAGTVDGTNFIGTTDNIPFNIRVNNQKAGRIDPILYNSFIGLLSGNAITTGSFNTANGYLALYRNTTGQSNDAHGRSALEFNTTGSYNVSFGYGSLYTNSSGNSNTGVGEGSLYHNATGSYNTGIGAGATVSSGNLTNATAIGANATVTASNAMQLGDGNVTQVSVGTGTTATLITGGLKVTGGSPGTGKVLTSDANGVATWQTASGSGSVWSLTGNASTIDGTNFIGTTDATPLNLRVNNQKAGRIDPILGTTFFGYQAGNSNAGGNSNTAFGYLASNSNSNGNENTAIGFSALYSNTGNDNTAVGMGTMYGNTSGNYNTAMGYNALSNKTGSHNTAIGGNALATYTTGNKNTAIGYNTNLSAIGFTNATAMGNGAVVQGSDIIQLGDANVSQVECWSGNYFTTSDARFKNNIRENDVKGLEFIKRLRPVIYNMDTKKLTEFMTKNMPDSIRNKHLENDFTRSSAILHSGFLAQEVEKAAQEADYNFSGVHIPENESGHYSLAYSNFVVPLVKAVQEQQQIIEKLEQRIEELEKVQISPEKTGKTTGVNSIHTFGSNFGMEQNEPNPFTHETLIKYTLPQEIKTAYLAVYDLSGKQIASFPITEKGSSSISITSDKLAAGIYIYSIVADNKIVDSKRMVVAEK